MAPAARASRRVGAWRATGLRPGQARVKTWAAAHAVGQARTVSAGCTRPPTLRSPFVFSRLTPRNSIGLATGPGVRMSKLVCRTTVKAGLAAALSASSCNSLRECCSGPPGLAANARVDGCAGLGVQSAATWNAVISGDVRCPTPSRSTARCRRWMSRYTPCCGSCATPSTWWGPSTAAGWACGLHGAPGRVKSAAARRDSLDGGDQRDHHHRGDFGQ